MITGGRTSGARKLAASLGTTSLLLLGSLIVDWPGCWRQFLTPTPILLGSPESPGNRHLEVAETTSSSASRPALRNLGKTPAGLREELGPVGLGLDVDVESERLARSVARPRDRLIASSEPARAPPDAVQR